MKVTINTDDLLIFDQTVSQEYLNLYRSGLMTAEELNAIREEGLKVYGQENAWGRQTSDSAGTSL
ncbi:adenosine deaminase [compost metagenome]